MTSRARFAALLAALVLSGLAIRLHGIGWDGFTHQNPDERFLTMVAGAIRLPSTPALYLDTARSPANPHNAGHPFYVYGTLPLFLFRGVAVALGLADYDGLLRVQRSLSIAADTATLLLAALLAFRVAPRAKEKAALLAAALYAFAPYPVQQARFGTVDAFGTAFVTGAVLAATSRRRLWPAAAAGALVGAAAACKPNLAVFALSVGLARLLVRLGPREGAPSPGRRLAAVCGEAALGAGSAFVVFRLAQPYAFAGPGLLGFSPSPRWLAGLAQLRSLLLNTSWYPPGVQWVDRTPLEPGASVFLWATGPLLGPWALAASVAVLHRALLRRDGEARPFLPVVAVVLPLLAWQLLQPTASVRYAHAPLALLAAVSGAAVPLLLRRLARPAGALLAGATLLSGLAFASIAVREHTRIEASRYLGRAFPRGATLATEHWDDPLPLPLPDLAWDRFRTEPLPVFDPDSRLKAERVLQGLAACDACVLSSRRAVGTLSRLPDAFPWTAELYRLLDSGALGFERAAVFSRRPGLGPFRIDDRGAEEALSVYDHPVVTIYRKTPRYSDALARQLLARVPLPAGGPPRPSEVRARGVPPDESPRARAAGWPAPPPPQSGGPLRQSVVVAVWLLLLETAGAAAAALLLPLGLPRAALAGLARPAGWVGAGLVWLWLGSLVPGYASLARPLAVAAAVGVAATGRGRAGLAAIGGRSRLLFLALFAGFLAVRMGNPEVFWGEKPMDGAILSAALRAPRLPIAEPWFDGTPLDYYAQGFLPVAFAARAAGASAGVAWNLACATLPAFLGAALAAAGTLLSRSRLGGASALVLGLLSGTLAPLLSKGFRNDPFGFSGFWAASRVTGPQGINEFPLFTALFADLHAHFHGWAPLAALLLLAAARLLRRPEPGSVSDRLGAAALGTLAAAVHLTNPWDTPLAALVLLAALPPRRADGPRLAGLTEPFLVAFGCAMLVALPALLTVRTGDAALGLEAPRPEAVRGYLELFGVPLAVLAAAWTLRGAGPRRRERVAVAAALLGLLVFVTAEVVVISDRMNTVFKLGLLARILLSAGAGALVPGLVATARRRGPGVRFALGALLAVSLVPVFAGAAHVAAVVRTRRVDGPRPALDGFAYVARLDPSGARRMLALNRRGGLPVIFDPPGRPYAPSLQMTMRTGCPTLVGWPWHLVQRRRSPAQIRLREADVQRVLSGPKDPVRAALVSSYGLSELDVAEGRPR